MTSFGTHHLSVRMVTGAVRLRPPEGWPTILEPSSFVDGGKKTKKGVAHYLDHRLGPAELARCLAPGHRRTLVHYKGGGVGSVVDWI